MSKIAPSALKPKFMAGAVPQQEDFVQLIDLAGQVREVNDGNGLGLNNGTLNINYGTVSTKLAGEGLTDNGDTLEVNYGTVSTKLAGVGLSASGNKLKLQVDGSGLSINDSDQLGVDYNKVSNNLAGNGINSTGTQLELEYRKIWMKMMALTHSATHYVELGPIIGFIRGYDKGPSSTASHVRISFYLADRPNNYIGIHKGEVQLKGSAPSFSSRLFGQINDGPFNPVVNAIWERATVSVGDTVKARMVRYGGYWGYNWQQGLVRAISDLDN
ncbi:hypothetical protein AND4_05324 [Vibrio sp. AND4]|nr:hypothetical protein AND4_05324 [Vibrio sp. AND4]